MTSERTSTATVAPSSNPRRKRLLSLLAIVFLTVGFIYFIYWAFYGRFFVSTDDAYVNGNLVQIMPQISGQVVEILADETDLVKKGQPLVVLDKANTYIALKNAEAQLALTARQVSQLYENVNELQANVVVQEENLLKAQEDLKRREGLVINKTITEEDFRHAKIAVDTAVASLSLAKNQLASALALVGNVDLYHHPQIEQAAVNLRNAFLSWQRTIIYASDTGYVSKRPVQVGQQVNPDTILMIIVPLEQIWVDANFKESQLRNIRIGQPAEVISDAYGNEVKFKGTVIGLNAGTGSAFDLLPPQNATGNWIKIVQRLPVRIGIDAKQLEKYPLRIGLSVTVTVNTHHRKGDVLTPTAHDRVVYQARDYSASLKKANEMIDEILKANAKNLTVPPTQPSP